MQKNVSVIDCVCRFQLPVLGQAGTGQTSRETNNPDTTKGQTGCHNATMREEGAIVGVCTCAVDWVAVVSHVHAAVNSNELRYPDFILSKDINLFHRAPTANSHLKTIQPYIEPASAAARFALRCARRPPAAGLLLGAAFALLLGPAAAPLPLDLFGAASFLPAAMKPLGP